MTAADQDARLAGVLNFRDVGRTVNQFLGQRRVRHGLLFRSARLDDATADDRRIIGDQLEIKTIIDLRTRTEHLKQEERFHAQNNDPNSRNGSADFATWYRISGINYHDVDISGRTFERFLVWQLSWWSLTKFMVLLALGYRMEAVAILGREVMVPRGLRGLSADMLDISGAEIRDALRTYTSAQTVPVLVHCTQGKDRTGLICALVLMILDVPMSAIEHDYFLSDAALAVQRDKRVKEIRAIGLPDEWTNTASDMITGVEEHLRTKYGGIDSYLDHIGFGVTDRAKLRETLLY